MEAAIWGLIGTVVGAGTSIVTTWIGTRSSLKLQESAKSLERKEQARAFQRQNLLELQDALHDATRMVTRAHLEDCELSKKSGRWGLPGLSGEVDEGVRTTGRKVSILVERIADDGLRSNLESATEATARVLLSKNQADSDKALTDAQAKFQQSMEHIGRVLRSFY